LVGSEDVRRAAVGVGVVVLCCVGQRNVSVDGTRRQECFRGKLCHDGRFERLGVALWSYPKVETTEVLARELNIKCRYRLGVGFCGQQYGKRLPGKARATVSRKGFWIAATLDGLEMTGTNRQKKNPRDRSGSYLT
jgi:hypothetical protein